MNCCNCNYNWKSRYSQFQSEKQQIVNAGLSDAEKAAQLQALVQQHFSSEEQSLIGDLQLGEYTPSANNVESESESESEAK